MGSIKITDLVACVSQFLMRELHEISKSQKKIGLIDYCSKTRSMLKRVKKIITWLRVYTQSLSKQQALESYTNSRALAQKEVANFLFSLKNQQTFNLRSPPFAINEAADILCRGEYYGFPRLGFVEDKKKVSIEKLTRIIKHKALLIEAPIGAELKY